MASHETVFHLVCLRLVKILEKKTSVSIRLYVKKTLIYLLNISFTQVKVFLTRGESDKSNIEITLTWRLLQ